MISERTLRKWRKETLGKISTPPHDDNVTILWNLLSINQDRVLKMTQELLDQHLMRK